MIVIKNGDKRMEHIAEFLDVEFSIDISKISGIVVLPPQGINKEGLIYNTNIHIKEIIKEVEFIFVGMASTLLKAVCDKNKISYYEYLKDEDVVIENARLTAEGLIKEMIDRTNISINKANVLILGYGKTGQMFSHILSDLNAYISVYARHYKDIISAKTLGYKYKMCLKDLKYDVIINTIPNELLVSNVLKTKNDFSLFLDIVSQHKQLIDKENKENVVCLPGLPGKYSPKTAGELIACKIKEILIVNMMFDEKNIT